MSKTTNDALSIAIGASVTETRTHLSGNTYQVTRSFRADEASRIAMLLHAARKYDETPDAAAERVRQGIERAMKGQGTDGRVIRGGVIAVVSIAIVIVCGLLGERMGDALLGVMAMLFALLIAVVHLVNARGVRARKLWQQHLANPGDARSTLEEMEEVLSGSALAAASKPLLIICLAAMVGFGAHTYLKMQPEPLHERLNALVGKYSVDYDECCEQLVDQNGQVSAKSQEGFSEAWSAAEGNALARYDLAVVAAHAAELGLDDGLAADCARTALAECDAVLLDKDDRLAELPTLLAKAPEAADARLLRILAALAETKTNAVVAIVSQYWSGRPLTEVLAAFDESSAGGNAEGAEIVAMSMLLGRSLEQAREELTALEDAAALPRAVQLYAGAYTAPDDVLSYIRLGAELGFTPTQCYPYGAVINLHTSHFNYNEVEIAEMELLEHLTGKFLVISRVEEREPYEKREVPESEWNKEESICVFPDEYSGNDALGDQAWTVMLSTELMEKMAPEYIPQTMAECQTVLVIEQSFVRDGFIRSTRYREENNSGVRRITNQWDIPTYAGQSLLALFDPAEGRMLYVMDVAYTGSPDVPQSAQDAGFTSDAQMRAYYSAELDLTQARQWYATLQQASEAGSCTLMDFMMPFIEE